MTGMVWSSSTIIILILMIIVKRWKTWCPREEKKNVDVSWKFFKWKLGVGALDLSKQHSGLPPYKRRS